MKNDLIFPKVLDFFKALADENRLKIVGLLARTPASGEELAQRLDLNPATVSRHLTRLIDAGLVVAQPKGHYNVYRLDIAALHNMARQLLAEDTFRHAIEDVVPNLPLEPGDDPYERKILRDFLLPDGRLKNIPSQRKKREVILRYIVDRFEPGRRYSESEVNELLGQFHEDSAWLRRELIGYRWLGRENATYWRNL